MVSQTGSDRIKDLDLHQSLIFEGSWQAHRQQEAKREGVVPGGYTIVESLKKELILKVDLSAEVVHRKGSYTFAPLELLPLLIM